MKVELRNRTKSWFDLQRISTDQSWCNKLVQQAGSTGNNLRDLDCRGGMGFLHVTLHYENIKDEKTFLSLISPLAFSVTLASFSLSLSRTNTRSIRRSALKPLTCLPSRHSCLPCMFLRALVRSEVNTQTHQVWEEAQTLVI
jgi:hypothetical protein